MKGMFAMLVVFAAGALAGCYILCPMLSKNNMLPSQRDGMPAPGGMPGGGDLKKDQGRSPMHKAAEAG